MILSLIFFAVSTVFGLAVLAVLFAAHRTPKPVEEVSLESVLRETFLGGS